MGFNDINIKVSGPIQPTAIYKTKVLKGNHSFASQVTEPNMKYVIKHDFVLDGDVTIPEGCLLEFDGGSLTNGTVVGNQTIIIGHQKISEIMDVTMYGTFVFDVNMITLAAVATSGSYNDLIDKPSFAAVATSGDYNDLTNKPTIPTVPTNVSAFNNDASYTKGSAGNTRPTDVDTGYMFFDTTLGENGGMPIWKTIDGWVDATGQTV